MDDTALSDDPCLVNHQFKKKSAHMRDIGMVFKCYFVTGEIYGVHYFRSPGLGAIIMRNWPTPGVSIWAFHGCLEYIFRIGVQNGVHINFGRNAEHRRYGVHAKHDAVSAKENTLILSTRSVKVEYLIVSYNGGTVPR